MSGGITGFIQANDTNYYCKLKAYYCDLKMELMLEKLQVDTKKVPLPNREEMILKLAKKLTLILPKFSSNTLLQTVCF